MRNAYVVFAIFVLAQGATACLGMVGSDAPPASSDGGASFDAGHGQEDSGSASDAGAGNTATDAGNTATDAGNTAIDAGNTATDAGNTAIDAGTADGGIDAGMLPTAVDNSQMVGFPPILEQGPLNSCVAFATTYYLLTHEVNLLRGRDGSLAANQFSPKWTYNLLVSGADTGTFVPDATSLLTRHGATNQANFPYDLNYRAWPVSQTDWENALEHRVEQSLNFYNCDTKAGAADLKAWLAAGHVALTQTFITKWVFAKIANDPTTAADDDEVGKDVVSSVTSADSTFHVLTIVGYDDTLWVDQNKNGTIEPGERGAFRIANSYGPSWKDNGFTWFAYDALPTTSAVSGGPSRIQGWKGALGATATGLTVRSTPVSVVARVSVRHSKRNQLALRLGTSAATDTTPSRMLSSTVPLHSGGAYAFDGTSTPGAATFVFDLTDIATSGETAAWYLSVEDDVTAGDAELLAFDIVDKERGIVTSVTASLPLTVGASTHTYRIDYAY